MDVRVILVEPELAENIGAVARVMKNFGFRELYLVRPPALTEKMFWVASHAEDVLRASTVVSSLDDAITGSKLVVGTTAKTGISASRHLRKPLFSPRELVAKVADGEGLLALLFGPEDRGLLNEELVHCDLVVSIPTSAVYPVLNLSHAVAIVLYELYELYELQEQQAFEPGSSMQQPALAAVADKERLFQHISMFLEEIEYRAHKRTRTMLMLRRLLGRAVLTAREVRTLRGILRSAERKIRERERERREQR